MQQQIAYMNQQLQQQQQVPVVTFKSFQAVNPPEFKGSSDPIEARAWLKKIEKASSLAKVGDK